MLFRTYVNERAAESGKNVGEILTELGAKSRVSLASLRLYYRGVSPESVDTIVALARATELAVDARDLNPKLRDALR